MHSQCAVHKLSLSLHCQLKSVCSFHCYLLSTSCLLSNSCSRDSWLLLFSGSTFTSDCVTREDLDLCSDLGEGFPTEAVALDFFWKLIFDQEVRWVVILTDITLCFSYNYSSLISENTWLSIGSRECRDLSNKNISVRDKRKSIEIEIVKTSVRSAMRGRGGRVQIWGCDKEVEALKQHRQMIICSSTRRF